MIMFQTFVNDDTGETFDRRTFDVQLRTGIFYRLMKAYGRCVGAMYRQNGSRTFNQSGWKFSKKVFDSDGNKFTQVTLIEVHPNTDEVVYQGLKAIV